MRNFNLAKLFFLLGFLSLGFFITPKVVVIASMAPQVSQLKSQVVYLTFDADMTINMKKMSTAGQVKLWYDPQILSFLEQQQATSTLFTTGMFAEMYPKVITDAANFGWTIGNHTYDHKAFNLPCYNLPLAKTEVDKKQEILKTQNVIKKLLGQEPFLFRYPGLCKSASDDSLVQGLGLRPVAADVVSGDAFNKNANGIARHVLNKIHSGSVVLFHLGGPHAPATLLVLKKIIPELKSQGYNFAPIH